MRLNLKVKRNETPVLHTLKLHIKCTDQFMCEFVDDEGNVILDHEGDVPGFFPGENYGEYLILDIDPTTGQILNWKATPGKVQAFIQNELEKLYEDS